MAAVNTGTQVTDALATEALAFHRKLPQLLVRYEGEFIAPHRGRVVGHGPNDEELAERIYERLGDSSKTSI